MNTTQFLRGMSIGVAVGAAIGALTSTSPKSLKKSPAGKAIKVMGDVVDNLADAMGL